MTATTISTTNAARSANEFADRRKDISEESCEAQSSAIGLLGRRCEHFFYVLPVHEVIQERLEIVGPPIAVVDVIGVLPYVAAEDRRRSVNERIFAIRRFAHDQFSIFHGEPGPTRAKLRHSSLREVFLHLGDAAEVAIDLCLELAGNLVASTIRLHPFPEVRMVVMLTCVVEEAGVLTERSFDDFLERFAFEPAAFEKFIAIIDVGFVMLVVMIFERLARHVGSKRIMSVGKVGQLERHHFLLGAQTMITE